VLIKELGRITLTYALQLTKNRSRTHARDAMAYDPADPFGVFQDLPKRAESLLRHPATIDAATGEELDAGEIARAMIDAPAIIRRLADAAAGLKAMTNQEIRACEILLDRVVARAAQRVDVKAEVTVRDRSRELKALIDLVSNPANLSRDAKGRPTFVVPTLELDVKAARADGAGPPEDPQIRAESTS